MKIILLYISFLLYADYVNCQNYTAILGISKDIEKYTHHYFDPLSASETNNLSNSWCNSGKVLDKFKMAFSLNYISTIIPHTKRSFLFSNSDYSVLECASPNGTLQLSTVFGSSANNQTIHIKNDMNPFTTPIIINAPDGFGANFSKYNIIFSYFYYYSNR